MAVMLMFDAVGTLWELSRNVFDGYVSVCAVSFIGQSGEQSKKHTATQFISLPLRNALFYFTHFVCSAIVRTNATLLRTLGSSASDIK